MGRDYEFLDRLLDQKVDHIEELQAKLREAQPKAKFVDRLCEHIGVTFEELIEDESVKAALFSEEENDEPMRSDEGGFR